MLRLSISLPLKNSDRMFRISPKDYSQVSKKKWGLICKGKYVATRIRGEMIYLHRHLLGLKKSDGVKTDHRDRDGLNNCRWNLRKCNDTQNSRNRRRIGMSIYRGVTKSHANKTNPWRAQITVNYRLITLGEFATERDAALAYNIAARKLHKKFASLNNLPENEKPKKRRRRKTSRQTGVCFHPSTGKWRAYKWENGKQKHLGLFPTEKEAIKARIK